MKISPWYDVLLITPYYKSVSNDRKQGTKLLPSAKLQASPSHFFYSPSLLTYLDLFHFPLRGREQADFGTENSGIKAYHQKVKTLKWRSNLNL